MKVKFLLFIYAITINIAYSQNTGNPILKESYNAIFKKINSSDGDSIRQRFYLEAYMQKARMENNWEKIVNGYKNYLHQSPRKQMIVYADSMVYTALDSGDKNLMASAYLTKGLTYYWNKNYVDALDNYILSYKHLQESDSKDLYLKHKLGYNMGLIKYYLGQYDEAISELKPALEYYETHNPKPYLVTLHFMGLCYRSNGNYKMCSTINRKGIKKGKEFADRSVEVYFRSSEGINQYYKGNYKAAIDSLVKSLPQIQKYGDFANLTMAHYYIGKSYWDLDNQQAAIPYLELVDQSATKNNYIKQEILNTYTILGDYYKSRGENFTYQKYMKKHLQATKTLMERKSNLFPKISKEYDQAKIASKQNMTQNQGKVIKITELSGLVWLLVLGIVLLISFLFWYLFRNKIPNSKNKYKQINKKSVNPAKPASDELKMKVSEDTKEHILNCLEKFEENEKFRDLNTSLASLASDINTNTTYISSVIKQEKGMNFHAFLTELRLNWFIKTLNANFDKETTDMDYFTKLSEQAGFSSMQSCLKHFKKKTGKTPSKYLEELKKA